MFTHRRTDWTLPTQPITGSLASWSAIDTIVIHYTAATNVIDGDPGEDWMGVAGRLRAMQADYLRTRGFSLGYNCMIDARGVSWEIRGFDLRNAANLGNKANAGINRRSFSILMYVDGNDTGTPAAMKEARRVIEHAERLARRQLRIVCHSDVDATACPGTGLRAQVAIGEFSPRWGAQPEPPVITPPVVLPPPVTPPPGEEDLMSNIIITNAEQFFQHGPGIVKFLLMESGKLRHLQPTEWATRGSQPGSPWLNSQIAAAGVIS